MLPPTTGAQRRFINLSAKLFAIFITEWIYGDNGGLEYNGGAREHNVICAEGQMPYGSGWVKISQSLKKGNHAVEFNQHQGGNRIYS